MIPRAPGERAVPGGEGPRARPGRLLRGSARAVVAARYVVLLLWASLAALAVWAPSTGAGTEATRLQAFIDPQDTTLATETASARAFGFPLISRTVLVQHDPQGLSVYDQAQAVLRATALTRGEYEDAGPIVGALPVTNTLAAFPGSTRAGTTALTFLLMDPDEGLGDRTSAAQRWAAEHLDAEDSFVGVSGSVPARVQQARTLHEELALVEVTTLGAIAVVVGLHFRSLVAPVLAIVTAGTAFFVSLRLAELVAGAMGTGVPEELRPLVLALLLGVVTDYVIFYLTGVRRALAEGADRLTAARTATAQYGPIVAVAGVTVAAGTAALVVADSPFFAAVGPAMAMSVLVGVLVSTTLVPAVMAVLGRALFWPSRPVRTPPAASGAGRRAAARRERGVRLLTRRPVALAVVLGCTALLAAASLPLQQLRLGVGFVPSLPADAPVHVAADAAAEGFAPGIVSPTVLLVQGEGVTGQRRQLAALGAALERQPGVAGVLGPGDLPEELARRALLAPQGDAARFLVVLAGDPMGGTAIADLRALREDLPALLAGAGLGGAERGVGGDTALASALVALTEDDVGRIALAALGVNLLVLVLFLRALVAPLYLLATSVLALTASLGLATWLFQDLLGHDGLTFYVPFAAAVLLVALGSDYNVFGVGTIWAQARTAPLREAVVRAVPQSSRAITAAAVTLALSFGLLALVPLRSFLELAVVMALGIVLDAIVVRSLLVPTLLVLVGPVSGWPGHALSRDAAARGTPPRTAAPAGRP
ncbi:MMPL family transporter [Kineococcus auxinigenes]|uniref:MMPL family transporter n=1 Tax=unclassified Kineococcus TaxID=2621656 RepID=UPI003D7D21B7